MICDMRSSMFVGVAKNSFLISLFHFLLLLSFLLNFPLDNPVVLKIVLVSAPLKEVFKHISHRCVLRPLIVPHTAALIQIVGELSWKLLTQYLH
jgi:hypothetical protein